MEARDRGAEDAIFVSPGPSGTITDGLVGEASATNVLIALPGPDGTPRLVTPDLESVSILAGVTRDLLLEHEPDIEERPVTVDELRRASEILLCGTNTMVASVLTLEGRPVGDGRVGPVARRLARSLVEIIGAELDARVAV
jgi:branched-subunit amino acid aminotransferase/4-amino-4-deoxychorismate lyase